MSAINSRLNKLEREAATGKKEMVLLWRPPDDMPRTAEPWIEYEETKAKAENNPLAHVIEFDLICKNL